MSSDAVHRSFLRTSEAIDVCVILLSIGLSFWVPLPWPAWLGWPARVLLGAASLACGVYLIVRSRADLIAGEQRPEPGFATTRIVEIGVYARSRNPLYLASFPLYAAAGLFFATLWPIALIAPAVAAFHFWLVRPEERYLAERFPGEYEAYAARVGRWWTLRRRGV